MSVATAAYHEPAELTYLSADDTNNLVHFQAASASKANGPWNTVGLDVLTGETHCTCEGAEANRECWHQTLVQPAWDAHSARQLARQYTADQLVKVGTKAARMVRVYRRRTWRVLRCCPWTRWIIRFRRGNWEFGNFVAVVSPQDRRSQTRRFGRQMAVQRPGSRRARTRPASCFPGQVPVRPGQGSVRGARQNYPPCPWAAPALADATSGGPVLARPAAPATPSYQA